MTDFPKIPHGYKRVAGQAQKGDGIWNGTRFAKAKKQYPFAEPAEYIIIRKCAVNQPTLPGAGKAEVVEL